MHNVIRIFTVRYTDYSDSNQAANVQADLSFCRLHMGYGNSIHGTAHMTLKFNTCIILCDTKKLKAIFIWWII